MRFWRLSLFAEQAKPSDRAPKWAPQRPKSKREREIMACATWLEEHILPKARGMVRSQTRGFLLAHAWQGLARQSLLAPADLKQLEVVATLAVESVMARLAVSAGLPEHSAQTTRLSQAA